MPNAGISKHTVQNLRSHESGEHAKSVREVRLKRRIQPELVGEVVSVNQIFYSATSLEGGQRKREVHQSRPTQPRMRTNTASSQCERNDVTGPSIPYVLADAQILDEKP
jgi:hypothetical protein